MNNSGDFSKDLTLDEFEQVAGGDTTGGAANEPVVVASGGAGAEPGAGGPVGGSGHPSH